MQVLELPASASKQDIEQAFRRLCKERHPDAGGNADSFIELREAYETALAQIDEEPDSKNGESLIRLKVPLEHMFADEIVFEVAENSYRALEPLNDSPRFMLDEDRVVFVIEQTISVPRGFYVNGNDVFHLAGGRERITTLYGEELQAGDRAVQVEAGRGMKSKEGRGDYIVIWSATDDRDLRGRKDLFRDD